jgi:hypothetical protein
MTHKSTCKRRCNDKDSSGAILNAFLLQLLLNGYYHHIDFLQETDLEIRKCVDLTTAFLWLDCFNPCGYRDCPVSHSWIPCGRTAGNTYGCGAANVDVNAYRVLQLCPPLYAAAPRIATTVTPAESSLRVICDIYGLRTTNLLSKTVYCAQYVSGIVPISSRYCTQNQLAASTSSIAVLGISGCFHKVTTMSTGMHWAT